MPKKPPGPFQIAIANRLRAIQAEMGRTDAQMAALVGVPRSRWANWKAAGNKPDEEALCRLWRPAKVTLEWLYCGDPSRMELGDVIRLTARMMGEDPDNATVEVLERAASAEVPVWAASSLSETPERKTAATSTPSKASAGRPSARTQLASTSRK